VYVFARIVDELGRLRPDIPILVVESRGTEGTVADCGIDLARHGTIHFMGRTNDPRLFWSLTRVCLMPSLWWENQPLVAVEAMTNGIPVIASDRGGTPETLGRAGIVLALPGWMTAKTRVLPTPREVSHWVEAIVGLWDDRELYEEQRLKALGESQRWEASTIEAVHDDFFRRIASRSRLDD
jgi:glycosyltransferase involved in cell wall biosynthesis